MGVHDSKTVKNLKADLQAKDKEIADLKAHLKFESFHWSKAKIARALGLCRNTVAKIINEQRIVSTSKDAKGDLYELKKVAPFCFGKQAELLDGAEDGWITSDNLRIKSPKDRKDFYDSQKSKLAFEAECERYIPVEEHIKDKRDSFTIAVEFFNNFPAKLERENLATPEQVERLIQLSDNIRNLYAEELDKLYND